MNRILLFSAFEDIPEGVRNTLSYPNQRNVLISLDWYRLLFETSLRKKLVPRIYVSVANDGSVQGALFCGVKPGVHVRRLMSLTNFYSLEFAPSVTGERVNADAVVGQIVDYILSERPRWHVIDFRLLKPELLEVQALLSRFSKGYFQSYPFFQFENWCFSSVGQEFERYFAERASQVRNTIQRKQRKLEKNRPFSIKVVRELSPDLDQTVRDFVAVYNRSWKGPEPFPDFIPTLARVCATLGILRLGILYIDNSKPVAAQVWINRLEKAIIYKLAYDEDYRDLGVGSILSMEMFRIALDEDHVAEIDYGVGSESYKKDWMSSVRKIQGVAAFNRKTILGLLMIAWEMGRTRILRIYRWLAALSKRYHSTSGGKGRGTSELATTTRDG